MKSIFITTIIVVLFAATTFGEYKSLAFAASQPQSEGTMPQSGDLCGGTGGNGQIISVGDKTVTMKRNDDGRSQMIHLTSQATIKTSTGLAPLSNLKIGDRITLVGGPNPDGSFTADTVVVCASTKTNNPIIAKNMRTNSKNISSEIDSSIMLFFGFLWTGIAIFLRLKKKKSLVYLLFFTIFYIYFYKVLDYTLFQFQSLIILKMLLPDLMLRGITAGKSLNLIPLFTLTPEDVKTSLLNIALMIPFGFGLPFITNLRMQRTVVIGGLFSISIELLQLMSGLIAKMTFRIADINDLLFNTVGVALGYMVFLGFLRFYRSISRDWKIAKNPILQYIAERPQIKKPSGKQDYCGFDG